MENVSFGKTSRLHFAPDLVVFRYLMYKNNTSDKRSIQLQCLILSISVDHISDIFRFTRLFDAVSLLYDSESNASDDFVDTIQIYMPVA